MKTSTKIWHILANFLILLIVLVTQQRSNYDMTNPIEQVRAYTRWKEFDYVSWIVDALALKSSYGALNVTHYLSGEQQREQIFQHLDMLRRLHQVRDQNPSIYGDTAVPHKTSPSTQL